MTYSYWGVWLERGARAWPLYVIFLIARGCLLLLEFVSDSIQGRRPPLLTFLLFLVMSTFMQLLVPYLALRYCRRRLTSAHIDTSALSDSRRHGARVHAHTLLMERAQNRRVQTLFFHDIGETYLSAAQYMGGLDMLHPRMAHVTHPESASIIPLPVTVLFPSDVDPACLCHIGDLEDSQPERGQTILALWDRLWTQLDATVAFLGSGLETEGLVTHVPPAQKVSDVKALYRIVHTQLNRGSSQVGYVLFGVGRGAEAVFRAVADMSPEQARQIKGLVLESPLPDDSHLWRHYPASLRPYLAPVLGWPYPPATSARDIGASSWKHAHIEILVVNSMHDVSFSAARVDAFCNALQATAAGERVQSIFLNHSRKGHFFHDHADDIALYEKAAADFYGRVATNLQEEEER